MVNFKLWGIFTEREEMFGLKIITQIMHCGSEGENNEKKCARRMIFTKLPDCRITGWRDNDIDIKL